MQTLSVIIPVYNEEELVSRTLQKVVGADSCGLRKEIIIVDDGSTDQTGRNLKFKILNFKSNSNNKSQNTTIVFIQKKQNEGKGAALRAGFKKATGDILMVQDADEEYSVEDYRQLLLPFLGGHCKAVYGSRNMKRKKFRNNYSYFVFYLGGLFLTWIVNILFNLKLTDQPTGYKLFSKEVTHLLLMPKENRFSYEVAITATLAKHSIPIIEVPIHYRPRTLAEGKKINGVDFVSSVIVAIKYKFKIMKHGHKGI